MKETEILRGLQKAKAKYYAAGTAFVNTKPMNSFAQHAQNHADFVASRPQVAPQPAPVARPNDNPVLNAARNGIVGQALMKHQADVEDAAKYAEGTAFLSGEGTSTSDDIDAKLSHGEAVLPAKTVRAVGATNIARLIEQTNGQPPKGSVQARGGLHAAIGAIIQDDLSAPKPAVDHVLKGGVPGTEVVPYQAAAPAAQLPPAPARTGLGGAYDKLKGMASNGYNTAKNYAQGGATAAAVKAPSYSDNPGAAAASTIKGIPQLGGAASKLGALSFGADSLNHWSATGSDSGLSEAEKAQVVATDLGHGLGTGVGGVVGGTAGAAAGSAIPVAGTFLGGVAGGLGGAKAGYETTDALMGGLRKGANAVNGAFGGDDNYFKSTDDILAREATRVKGLQAAKAPMAPAPAINPSKTMSGTIGGPGVGTPDPVAIQNPAAEQVSLKGSDGGLAAARSAMAATNFQDGDTWGDRADKNHALRVLEAQAGVGARESAAQGNIYGTDKAAESSKYGTDLQFAANKANNLMTSYKLNNDMHNTRVQQNSDTFQNLFTDTNAKGEPQKGGANHAAAMDKLVGSIGKYGLDIGDMRPQDLNQFKELYDVSKTSDDFNNSVAGKAWHTLLQTRGAKSRDVANYGATAENPGVFINDTTRGVASRVPNSITYQGGEMFGLPDADLIAATKAKLNQLRAAN